MTSNDETIEASQIDDMIDRVDSIATDPLRRLAVAVTVRDDMTESGEAVLDHFVARARDAGHSWAEIGDVLGVTRQAAQQRDAGPGALRRMMMQVDPPMPPWGPGWAPEDVRGRGGRRSGGRRKGGGRGKGGGRHLMRHMSDETRDVFGQARAHAAEAGDRRVTTLHLLDALYEGGHADDFERVGLSRERVRAALDERRSGGTESPTDERWGDRPRMSPQAKRTIEVALRHAIRHEDDHITPRHLAIGLLRGRGRVADLLDEADVDRTQMLRDLDAD